MPGNANRAAQSTSVEALLPMVLEGLAITELPDSSRHNIFQRTQLQPILTDWRLPRRIVLRDATARARPAKVSAWPTS